MHDVVIEYLDQTFFQISTINDESLSFNKIMFLCNIYKIIIFIFM